MLKISERDNKKMATLQKDKKIPFINSKCKKRSFTINTHIMSTL